VVPDVALHEWPPTNEALVPGGKIVEHHGRVTRAAQGLAGMRADIACTPRDQNGGVVIAQCLNQGLCSRQRRCVWDLSVSEKPLKIRNGLGKPLLERGSGTPIE